jgi:hypothetical protein
MPGTRPPFQGDSLGDVFPRAEAHGLFCFRPLGDGKMSKLQAAGYANQPHFQWPPVRASWLLPAVTAPGTASLHRLLAHQARPLYFLAFFLAFTSEAAVFLFLTERMGLSLSPHPKIRLSLRGKNINRLAQNIANFCRPSQSGFRFASICLRLPSRIGGSDSRSPSAESGSSVENPGPSVASSNKIEFGSRK